MRQNRKSSRRKLIYVIIIIFIISACAFTLYEVKYREYNTNSIKNIFSKVEEENADLIEYIVYGTHLNLKGIIKTDESSIDEVNLIIAKLDGTEQKINLNYEKNNNRLTFYTSKLLNEGVDLESFTKNKYYLLIEVKANKKSKYYSISNKTEYNEVIYYTITKNNSNFKEQIGFDNCKVENKNIEYMMINVKRAKLPKDVYDIVIDPGHGGSDNGAEYEGYSEADLTLEYSKKIKQELERLGLKVKITRDGTENEDTFGAQTVYDKNGRVNIVRRV